MGIKWKYAVTGNRNHALTTLILGDGHKVDYSRYSNYNRRQNKKEVASCSFQKRKDRMRKKSWDNPWDEQVSQEILKRVSDFMREDDESFFRRTIQGLTLAEIEEFLIECPEFQKFWDKQN